MKFYLMIKLRIVSKGGLHYKNILRILSLYASPDVGFLLVCVMYSFCTLLMAFLPVS